MKRQATNWEKITAIHTVDTSLAHSIHKKYNPNNRIISKRHRHFTQEDNEWLINCEKMPNLINNQGNTVLH